MTFGKEKKTARSLSCFNYKKSNNFQSTRILADKSFHYVSGTKNFVLNFSKICSKLLLCYFLVTQPDFLPRQHFETFWGRKIWPKFCPNAKASATSCSPRSTTPPTPGESKLKELRCESNKNM